MANNIDNSEQLSITNALEKALKNAIRYQGDYRDIVSSSADKLKDLSKELQKQADYIENIVDRDKNRFIHLERIQKAQHRELLSTQKSIDLAGKLSVTERTNAELLVANIEAKTKLEKEFESVLRSGNKLKISGLANQLSGLDKQITKQEELLNTSELEYAAAIQISKSRTKATQDLIDQETQAGRLERRFSGINQGLKKAGEIGKGFTSFDNFTDMLGKLPGVGLILSGVVTSIKAMLDFMLDIEDRTVKFGRALGYSREESFKIASTFDNLTVSSGNLLLTTENLLEVQTDLSNKLGVTNILSDEMLTTQIELKKIIGLSADEMGSLAQSSIISGKNQKETVQGIIGQVAGLKQATGITFNYKQIIGEVTKLSGVLGLKFAKYPQALTKSALIAKSLGMDLAKVDQIAGSLLNFEESIQNQLEAQLITGKDINLSRAQQLALEGDTAGVAIEISKQFGTANEYLQMNRIQQESIAKAVGMTKDELADVLKNQEMLSKLGATDTKEAIKKLELLKAQGKTQEELVTLLGEGVYQNLTGLSAQEKIAALIDKVKGAFQAFLTESGVVEWVTGLIHKLTNPDNVKGLINTIKEGVAMIADIIQSIAMGILKMLDYVPGVETGDMIKKLEDFGSSGDRIRSMGSSNVAKVDDFVIQPLGEDTITMAGGTKLGRTDEMVDLLKQILSESKQGKTVTVSVDGQPLATAVARNASLTQAASNLGPRPLR